MEWQQLEYFCQVAKTEHFRKAANRLGISQPALSRSMAKLEEELGVPLFDRVGRSVKLNAFGRVFLKRVENALNEISVGVQEMEQLKNPDTGKISVAFLRTLGVTVLPELIHSFNRKYPRVEIQLIQSTILRSVELLKAREVDLCLISSYAFPPGIEWHPLMEQELFLYVPANHRLAARDFVDLKEIGGESFVGFREGLEMRERINHFCRKAGFTPVMKFEGEDVSTLAGLVSAGLGVTLIPEYQGISESKIKKISVRNPRCYRKIGLTWLKDNPLSPSAERFRSHVIEWFAT
jgi:DNA-binding transcriptional LysR family regulator